MAYQVYVTLEGTAQGKFKGEVEEQGMPNKIGCLTFEFEMNAPYDKATGASAGKRQMSPVRFVKEWGPASPQIFQALARNEVITSALFEFYRTGPDGARVIYYTIKLSEGKIVRHHQFVATAARQALVLDKSAAHELEEVSLIFQKMEVEHKLAKTMAAETWPA